MASISLSEMLKKECCGLSAQRESCIEMKAISIEVEIWIKEREGGWEEGPLRCTSSNFLLGKQERRDVVQIRCNVLSFAGSRISCTQIAPRRAVEKVAVEREGAPR